MGARALIDLFITSQIGDVGGFELKLEQLVAKGFLSEKNRDILQVALEAGHAAAHRGHKPSKEDCERVIDIVENLIQFHVLRESARSLKKSVPARRQKKRRAKSLETS